jgi:NADH:ubiquinone oxidoreductase subunit E
MFKKRPSGKYHIEVCTSVPCCMMGGYGILRHLEKKLGVHAGETTADGRFLVTEAECLAACGNAPLIQIDSVYYEKLTTEVLDEIIDNLE